MKKTLKYSGYAFMVLGWLFLPLYVYVSVLFLYLLIDNGIYFFRVRENLKGILCMIGSMLIVLFLYFNFMLDLIYKGLSNMNMTIF
jgi:hypothetical protein